MGICLYDLSQVAEPDAFWFSFVILERNGRDSRRSGVTNSLLALLSNMAEIVPLRDVALCH